MPGVVDNFQQTIDIPQDEGCAFISGEAPGKPNRQNIGIDQHTAGNCLHRMLAMGDPLRACAITHELGHAAFVVLVHFP